MHSSNNVWTHSLRHYYFTLANAFCRILRILCSHKQNCCCTHSGHSPLDRQSVSSACFYLYRRRGCRHHLLFAAFVRSLIPSFHFRETAMTAHLVIRWVVGYFECDKTYKGDWFVMEGNVIIYYLQICQKSCVTPHCNLQGDLIGCHTGKWRETKQQLIWWPDLALLGCCLVSLHFLYDIDPVQCGITQPTF